MNKPSSERVAEIVAAQKEAKKKAAIKAIHAASQK